MTELESSVLKRVMLTVCKGSNRLFRNNAGALQDKNGTWVRYGVANPGGSDLIGWRTVVVTPEMVGKPLAVFVALEVKALKGRATPEQLNFIAAVKQAGGLAGIVRSPEEAVAVLDSLPAHRPPQA